MFIFPFMRGRRQYDRYMRQKYDKTVLESITYHVRVILTFSELRIPIFNESSEISFLTDMPAYVDISVNEKIIPISRYGFQVPITLTGTEIADLNNKVDEFLFCKVEDMPIYLERVQDCIYQYKKAFDLKDTQEFYFNTESFINHNDDESKFTKEHVDQFVGVYNDY